MNNNDRFNILKSDFKSCTQVLTAIGDETRQLIVIVLIGSGCSGMRVGEITSQTHLSRPAVSHHLKILKDAGIVDVRKVATMNYYYLEPSSKLMNLKKLINNIEELINDHGKE
ncbi:metalloregulator ArsR/SmtB family transcription factor [Clostridium sp. C8]|uniref:Transcriptional regulator, ArsR family protein n=2 Tax=root TaxID=1 RepID=R9C5A7_9CLOT|nr:metalloregulator ArsR/SmtB family transcription factor [Clostridium sp. C8]EOR24487.1 transcriptional regulator, ArsR family protein [Clostridium sartagoforme AAU1]